VVDSAALLRRARLAAGLTQTELARRAGVTQSVISAYESGRREPALSTLARLVEAAGARLHLDLEDGAEFAPRPLPATDRGRRLRRRRQQVLRIAAEHGATDVRLFGSTARGEDGPSSDIDLLVHLGPEVGLFGLARLRRELQEVLGVPVDVVPDDGLAPSVRAAVQRDAVPL
jgi:predicted nucleotidyltransferase/DNA-binding XRE family transcriptional regulator